MAPPMNGPGGSRLTPTEDNCGTPRLQPRSGSPVGEAIVPENPFAPVALDEDGNPIVCCEKCGSVNLDFDGWDIDKCRDCGHWRYRQGGDRA
jgi:hypothetical protein